jgi:hypothetical protein
MSTGRLLSGLENTYHLTSPRFINHPKPVPIPSR